MTGTATVVRGDAHHLPLPDGSVDLVVTSPPYFGLRSYTDGGKHYPGQVGAEATPGEFVDALVACTREMARVTKPTGSIWVNLGDKYAGAGGGGAGSSDGGTGRGPRPPRRRGDVAAKSLLGVPWRYAIRCVDELGLILRAEVVWDKPNGLPESVTDRVKRSHETWFHLVRQPRYYSAVDLLREPYAGDRAESRRVKRPGDYKHAQSASWDPAGQAHPLGSLPGSVWRVPTQPLVVPPELGADHYAAFPLEWPRRLILGWSPPGVCGTCATGLRPVVEHTPMTWRPGPKAGAYETADTSRRVVSGTMLSPAAAKVVGWECECAEPGPTRPAVVLDPFSGTGTTALAAKALGRHGVGVDMSGDYCRIARWRTSDRRQIAAAMGVDRPAPEVVGQGALFT